MIKWFPIELTLTIKRPTKLFFVHVHDTNDMNSAWSLAIDPTQEPVQAAFVVDNEIDTSETFGLYRGNSFIGTARSV